MPKTPEEYKSLSVREFTQAAKIYDNTHAGIYTMCRKDYPAILEELAREPFETLLDAGCGTGPMIEILAEHYPNKHYTGIDLTPAMIEAAQAKHIADADFIVGDCENLPFANASFDVILCSNSAHHYPDLPAFYASVARCLAPGGRFILRDYTSDSALVRWFMHSIEMPLANRFGHGDVDMLHREEVARGLEEAGLTVEKNEIQKGGRLHLVARK